MKQIATKIYTTWILIIFPFFLQISFAQSSSEEVIIKAMKDELDRNMNELIYKDYEKPFFISYTIGDVTNMYVNATLGALNSSIENHFRDWSIRVMVGNYELNDENFSDMTNTLSSGDGQIDLPIENDYLGIRRSLWMTTNNVYKRASENYKNKVTALKQKKLSANDLQIADFCRVPVTNINIESQKPDFNKTWLEETVRELSSQFKEYKEIIYSTVSIVQLYADIYFMNSEGIQTKSPLSNVSIIISAQTIADDGEILANQITYYTESINDLPNIHAMNNDIKAMANNLIALKKAKRFNDSYSGPVLIIKEAVAEVFSKTLFSGLNSLIAHREALYNTPEMTMFYGQNNNSLESRIGKRVVSKDISVIVKPNLNTYNGINLIGDFLIDAEGVVPQDELTLIKDGFLQNLLNGRTPTRAVKKSNGHNRYSLSQGGLGKTVGPGVVFISSSKGKSVEELKNMLIEKAKEEGLDYAIMIQPISTNSSFKPMNIYQVSVKDGSEELLRSVNFKTITTNSLKNILGVSNKKIVYNTILSGADNGFNLSMFSSIGSGLRIANGLPSSFIVPDAILIEEVEIEKKQKMISSDLPILENPVGK